jgi:hypothetical protein
VKKKGRGLKDASPSMSATPDQAQPAVEAVLESALKRWKMVRIERTDGEARIVYAVRPKKGQNLDAISSTLTNEAAPFVASVEVERWA